MQYCDDVQTLAAACFVAHSVALHQLANDAANCGFHAVFHITLLMMCNSHQLPPVAPTVPCRTSPALSADCVALPRQRPA